MIRAAALLLFISVFSVNLLAQRGNEWINHAQSYVKISVGSTGLYRISYQDLQNAGFPVEAINSAKLQVFHRGVEQAILVKDNGGGFEASDYLEFYGRKNDGTLDKLLYQPASAQPHDFYNLFNDTTAYFLTLGVANGKRMQSYQEPSNSLSPEPYHRDDKLSIQTDNYSVGTDYGLVYSSAFDKGEGWMSPIIPYNQPVTFFTVKDIVRTVTSAPAPTLELVLTGRGERPHPVDVFVGARLLKQYTVDGFQSLKISETINWSDIDVNGELKVGVKVNGEATRVSVNYIRVFYGQRYDMSNMANYMFNVVERTSGKAYIEIQNAPAGTRIFDVTNPNQPTLVDATSSSVLSASIRDATVERKLFATSSFITPKLKKVSFRNFTSASKEYVIISHPILSKPAGGSGDAVKAYAEYRASEQGGGYDTLVVNVTDLYNQFSYGEETPLAIFNFMRFLADFEVPRYLLLIGKGLDVVYNYSRQPTLFTTYKNLVPTAGYPGSDIAYTAGLGGSTYGPGVATGRIPAMKPQDVIAYLNKVKETEARPFDDLRRKNVLHLSGGIHAGEPQRFRSYLNEFKPIAENFYLGGYVDQVAKQSTDLKLINIAEEVNKGLNLVTFFGHSSPSILDFDIGYVTDPVLGYNNRGKYPVLLMNGCAVGAFFLNEKLFGEDWITAADKGAIGFIAHSSYGFEGALRNFSNLFYNTGFGDSTYISKGLGDIHKAVANKYASSGSFILDITQAQQMILLGDPAIPLFGAAAPDYSIKDEDISLSSMNDEPVTVNSDSFAITFIVKNFGLSKDKELRVEVIRTLNDRSTITYDSVFRPILYSDTLQFVIRNNVNRGFGNNTFEVRLDAGNEVAELNEGNNVAYLDYFIPANGTHNLYPAKYGIVKTKEVTLSFQHTDILSSTREFLVEVDTSYLFNSAFKQAYTVNAKVLATTKITLLDQDSLVYYWRTRLAQPLESESREWTQSSFTFIHNGPDGWAQIDYPQFTENNLTGLQGILSSRRLNFQETKATLALTTFGAGAGQPAEAVSVKINQAEYNLKNQGYLCRNNSINLIAFDKSTTVPYPGIPIVGFTNFGLACGRQPWVINNYLPNELVGSDRDILHYIDNIVEGDSVVLFNIGDASVNTWPDAVKSKLGELGIAVTQLAGFNVGDPVIIFGKKGASPGSAVVHRASTGSASSATLSVNATITGGFNAGEIKTQLIGPAKKWNRFYSRLTNKEPSDEVRIDITGVSLAGTEKLLFENVTEQLDLTSVAAVEYPYLRIRMNASDEINLTFSQPDHWIIDFDPVPEGLIFYNGSTEKSTLQEGQTWAAEFGFVNVSNESFEEPLAVLTRVFNHTSAKTTDQILNITPPNPGDTTLFNINVSTEKKRGLNDVRVTANPQIQREQYYENNTFALTRHINVLGESFNPVLDVTFDGRYIQQGEFVSTDPDIAIKVWDENEYLLIKDTVGLELLLAKPCDQDMCPFERIYFSSPEIEWHPATDTSYFNVLYKPNFTEDGRYTLRITSNDFSGNKSGQDPYEISFQVTNEFAVTISDPYPNPSFDVVNFNFVVSGNDEPKLVAIDIYSLNGVKVQSLQTSDGQLRVGNNTLTWDCKGLNGNFLPAGIYIYRTTFHKEGQVSEKRGKISIAK